MKKIDPNKSSGRKQCDSRGKQLIQLTEDVFASKVTTQTTISIS